MNDDLALALLEAIHAAAGSATHEFLLEQASATFGRQVHTVELEATLVPMLAEHWVHALSPKRAEVGPLRYYLTPGGLAELKVRRGVLPS